MKKIVSVVLTLFIISALQIQVSASTITKQMKISNINYDKKTLTYNVVAKDFNGSKYIIQKFTNEKYSWFRQLGLSLKLNGKKVKVTIDDNDTPKNSKDDKLNFEGDEE